MRTFLLCFSITLLVTMLAVVPLLLPESRPKIPMPADTQTDAAAQPAEDGPKAPGELRALWIASVGNLDFPSRPGLSAEALTAELTSLADLALSLGMNALFFQVRPTADALYASDLFPVSRYLSGKEGAAADGETDCLAVLTDIARARGLSVFAWVNPLRVRTDVSVPLAAASPAALHPEWTVRCGGGLWFDPGIAAVRALCADGVREIAGRYDVDGIVFDDYFYPYPEDGEAFDDAASFAAFGGGMSLADFRRENICLLLAACHDAVKAADPALLFGVSPFGIGKTSGNVRGLSAYDDLYCDVQAWVEAGTVDFLIPQLYFAFDHPTAPFAALCGFWQALVRDTDTKLYIGLGAYRYAEDEYRTGELARQIAYARAAGADGFACYGLAALKADAGGAAAEIKNAFSGP